MIVLTYNPSAWEVEAGGDGGKVIFGYIVNLRPRINELLPKKNNRKTVLGLEEKH